MNEQVSHLDQLITDAPDLASVDQVHAMAIIIPAAVACYVVR